ncbi:MAG: carboxypeptidase regulatory-like domain-containing protein, partial [Gemmatimonadaceae bacterium]
RICGLSNQLEGGTLQASKQGVLTSEVRLNIEGQALVIQGLRIGNTNTVVKTESDSAAKRAREAATGQTFSAVTVQRGDASLTGKVLNANGNPVVGARVDVVGTPGATLTRESGEFSLTGLPSGTQSLVVRQLGYEPVEQAVELSTRAAARVVVVMTKPAQVLTPVVVTAEATAGLDRVGFNQRKKSSGGTFITGDDVMKRAPNMLSDVFRSVPGLRVVPVGNDYQIESSRNVMGGCVTYWVDGSPFEAMFPGDIDRLYPPQEISGIEVYPSGSSVPAQFQQAGKSSCAAVVIWSRTRTDRFPPGRKR